MKRSQALTWASISRVLTLDLQSKPMNKNLRLLYRLVAAFEAFTWAGLLVGMAFKYLINGNPLGVRIFGSLHGGAFIAYVVLTVLCARRFRWTLKTLAVGVLASLPPFTTLVFDVWLERNAMFQDQTRASQLKLTSSGGSAESPEPIPPGNPAASA